MFKNETKNAMMAMAVVAMFMLSACAIFFADSDAVAADENDGNSYIINMGVNDTFTYAPAANLDNTTFSWSTPVKLSGETSTSSGWTVNSNTGALTFVPNAAGSIKSTLTATWGTGALQQTATQEITFVVYNKITFSGPTATGVDNSTTAATASIQLLEGMTSAAVYEFTVSGGNNAHIDSATPTANSGITAVIGTGSNNNKVTVTVPTTVTPGNYSVAIVADGSKTAGNSTLENSMTSTKTLNFSISVLEGIVITGDQEITTVLHTDKGDHSVEYGIEDATKIDSNVTWSATKTAASDNWASSQADAYFTATNKAADDTEYTLTFPTTAFDNSAFSANAQSATISFTVTATSTLTADSNVSVTASLPVVLTVYRELKFTTTPVIATTQTNVMASSSNGLDVLISTSIDGANKISYDWGDGTKFSKSEFSADASFYTANHTYAQPGTYFITITASNDFGETSYITPYTTGAEIIWNTDKTLKMTGIDAKTDGDNLTLTGKAIVTDGVTTSYKWTYTSGDIKDKVITNEDKPAWVVSVSGKTLVLTKADVPDNTKFVCEVSATFEGDTEATTSSASYIYNDANFFSQNPWALWIPIIVAAVLLVVMLFVTGFLPPMLIATGLAVIAQIVMLALRFFSII